MLIVKLNSVIRSNLCDFSDVYIYVKATITVPNTAASAVLVNNTSKKVIFKNCPFTNCISKINNTQADDAQDIDIVMPMYNLTKYSDVYSKTSGSLWQYFRDEPALDNNDNVIDFTANKDIILFKFKQQITGQTGNSGTENVEIIVLLKYLSNFWRTLEMSLINCEISFRLNCLKTIF